jgi:uncharacterized phage protein (TIGR02218 family)
MKSASANLIAHIEGEATTTCWLYRIARTDGEVRRFTNHDAPLTLDVGFGAETFHPGGAPLRTAIEAGAGFGADDLEASGPTIELSSDAIDADELRDGFYDEAEIRVYEVNWDAPGDGVIKVLRGWLGEASYADGRYTMQFESMSKRLERGPVRHVMPYCDVDEFGDSRCGIVIDPPVRQDETAYAVGDAIKLPAYDGRRYTCTVAGITAVAEPSYDTTVGETTVDGTASFLCAQALTQLAAVATVTDRVTFTVGADGGNPAPDAPDGHFAGGKAMFTSGANAGRTIEVKTWTLSTSAIVLKLPAPRDIEVGDTLSLIAGCDRTEARCLELDNILRFRGFPDVPTGGEMLKTPDAS